LVALGAVPTNQLLSLDESFGGRASGGRQHVPKSKPFECAKAEQKSRKPREESTMFRKILIAVAASLSLLSPLAIPAETQAHEVMHRHHEYRVYFRTCNREAWRCSGEYRCREDAIHAAHHYRERGFEAYVG
jgi:hypothetical protein